LKELTSLPPLPSLPVAALADALPVAALAEPLPVASLAEALPVASLAEALPLAALPESLPLPEVEEELESAAAAVDDEELEPPVAGLCGLCLGGVSNSTHKK
jgi:hypothetical protein